MHKGRAWLRSGLRAIQIRAVPPGDGPATNLRPGMGRDFADVYAEQSWK